MEIWCQIQRIDRSYSVTSVYTLRGYFECLHEKVKYLLCRYTEHFSGFAGVSMEMQENRSLNFKDFRQYQVNLMDIWSKSIVFGINQWISVTRLLQIDVLRGCYR